MVIFILQKKIVVEFHNTQIVTDSALIDKHICSVKISYIRFIDLVIIQIGYCARVYQSITDEEDFFIF